MKKITKSPHRPALRLKSENEKEIELLVPALSKIIVIKKHSKKFKQFHKFE